jgi:serine/threonine protein phosphatase PrpC
MSDNDSISPSSGAMWPFLRPEDSPPRSVSVEVGLAAEQWRAPRHTVNDAHYAVVRMARHHETLMTSLPDRDLPDFTETGYGLVIADGMGSAGEQASRLAIATLVQFSIDFGRWNLRINEPLADEVIDRAERFCRSIDATLLQASRDLPDPLQSTLTAAYSAGNELFFVHVGRSRVYMFRDGELMQLTRDHAARGNHSLTPILSLATRARAPRPGVPEALGRSGPGAARVDIERLGLLDGDRILLCTHGLTDAVDDQRIAEVMRQNESAEDLCLALIALAAASGAQDDVTVLAAQYRISDYPEPAIEIVAGP